MQNNPNNYYLIPRILSTFDIVCFLYIIFLMLIIVFNDLLPEFDNPGSYSLLTFIMLGCFKYHLIRYIYKDHTSFKTKFTLDSEHKTSLLVFAFISIIFIYLISSNINYLSFYIFSFLLMLSAFRWLAIVPEGILTNSGFYTWDQINELKWSKDGQYIILSIKNPPLNIFIWPKYQFFIHPEKREQLNQAIIKHLGTPIKTEETYTDQQSSA